MSKIYNAIIRSVTIECSDNTRGCLSGWVFVDLEGGGGQGFGGFALDTNNPNKTKGCHDSWRLPSVALGIWVMGIMHAIGVEKWQDLINKPCRVKKTDDWGNITAIGHFLENKWFDPKVEFAKYMETE